MDMLTKRNEEDMRMEKNDRLLLGLGAAALALATPVWLLAPGTATKRQRAPFYGANFAHRGLHSRDKSVPENSLEAFRLAAEAGYGVELDVQLSKDGQVVVFHDNDLERVCGVEDRVDEWTYEELQTLRLVGTEQRIPLLSEVLQVIRGRGPLIVELKSGSSARRPTPYWRTTEARCAWRASIPRSWPGSAATARIWSVGSWPPPPGTM